MILTQAENVPEQAGRPWKKIVLLVGGLGVTAAGAVIVTLAATHKSAVAQNAGAYANGLVDGYSNGFVDGYMNGLVDGVEATAA